MTMRSRILRWLELRCHEGHKTTLVESGGRPESWCFECHPELWAKVRVEPWNA